MLIRMIAALLMLVAAPSAIAAGKPLSISLSPSAATITEGQSATFLLSKSGGNGRVTSASISASDGSFSAVVVLGQSFSIATLDDAILNGTRAITIKATASTGATASAVITILDNDVAPPTPAPSNALSGLPPIADNFDTAAGLQIGPTYTHPPSGEEIGAFRVLCSAGQLLKDDPIRFPGQPGASHLHQFWGNTGANANSTYQSLRTSGGSTCDDAASPINRTAYWMPAMLDGAGNVVKPDFINTYYKQVPAGSTLCAARAPGGCVGLPNAIEAIFGYNMASGQNGPMDANSMDYWAFKFECWTSPTSGIAAVSPPAGQHFTNIADVAAAGCPAGSGLIIYFAVPGCWDGKNLDSADHRSHLSYGTDATGGQVCPADHPYLISPWQGHVHFTTDANFVAGKWHLSSDEMLPGFVVGPGSPVKAGMSLHFDYWEGWSPAVKHVWQSHCIDGHLTCSGGDLGDGRQIKGADGAALPPPHQLVPLSQIP